MAGFLTHVSEAKENTVQRKIILSYGLNYFYNFFRIKCSVNNKKQPDIKGDMIIWFQTKRKQTVERDLQGIQVIVLSDLDKKEALQNMFTN